MQRQTSKAQLHQHQDQWTENVGQEDYNQRNEVPHKSRNQVFI
jgi:hypothetical protein